MESVNTDGMDASTLSLLLRAYDTSVLTEEQVAFVGVVVDEVLSEDGFVKHLATSEKSSMLKGMFSWAIGRKVSTSYVRDSKRFLLPMLTQGNSGMLDAFVEAIYNLCVLRLPVSHL